jgi:hypothetical protein
MYTLSPSHLRLYRECKRCFWLLLKEGKKRPSSIYPSLPYGIGQALARRFDYYRDKGQVPRELRQVPGIKLCDHPLMALWRDYRKGIRYKDEQGNLLLGSVDDVLQLDEQLLVLHYVTRGFPAKEETAKYYQDKLNMYTFLLQKSGFPVAAYAYLLFYYPKDVNWQGDIWFRKELLKIPVSVQDAEKLFMDALEMLDKGLPEKTLGCEWCEW